MAEKFEYTREWTNAEAFPLLGFTKSWENPEDYPTIELDETQVRKDMQSLHDEVKNYINDKLIPAVLAEDATEAARAAAEAQREANETQRIENENARIAAEQARVDETNGIVAQAAAQAKAAAESAAQAKQIAIGDIPDGTLPESKLVEEARAAIDRAKVGGEIDAILNAAEYSSAQTYALGDYCKHAGKLYRCTTAITEAEAWTDNHWTETSVSDELKAISTLLQKKADLGEDGKVLSEQLPEFPKAVLNITTNADAVVTATKGSKVLSATADSSGLAVLYPDELGTWTLKATIGGKSIEVYFEIDAIAVFNTYLNDDLEAASWQQISGVAEAGNAASIWSVGDTKTINIGGVSYTAQIIGFNHDTKTAGGKAGITFQLVDCLNTTYQMNTSNTNVGGWKSSAMRSRMSEFLGQLDEELQSVIKPVDKLVSVGNNSSTIETVSDKLFLLSEVEILGYTSFTFEGEGSQYDYYKAGNTKVKTVNGSASNWWGRSPLNGYTNLFICVASNGSIDNNRADNSNGVSFAFCV